eukprot:XP_017168542.1 PREDICTED: serine/arginine repetitive matrix protein 3-like [Mus musculus]
MLFSGGAPRRAPREREGAGRGSGPGGGARGRRRARLHRSRPDRAAALRRRLALRAPASARPPGEGRWRARARAREDPGAPCPSPGPGSGRRAPVSAARGWDLKGQELRNGKEPGTASARRGGEPGGGAGAAGNRGPRGPHPATSGDTRTAARAGHDLTERLLPTTVMAAIGAQVSASESCSQPLASFYFCALCASLSLLQSSLLMMKM